MAQYSWKEVIEGIGVLSIVASLVFVGLQIKQEQEIARAQLGSETSELVSSIYLTMTEPDFASAYSKMLHHPEQLTPEEMVQVNGLLSSVAEMLFRECYLLDRGVFVECESFMRVHGERFFGNRYAKSWWRHNRPPSLYGLVNDFDSIISGFDENSSRQSLEKVWAEM